MEKHIDIKNKRARFEYFLSDEVVAGIVLSGTEIKSIRLGKANIADAYCVFMNGELFVKNMHISDYVFASYNRHDPRSERKLLLNRKELRKFEMKTKERGYTIVPIRLFINEKGLAKLEIALARGKKLFDKRDSIKAKDVQRDLDRQKF
jgi:SsrA-binding protein